MSLCGYVPLLLAWAVPDPDRGATLYLALTEMHEHYRSLRVAEQTMLDLRVRRTSRVLSSLHIIIDEIEHTMEHIILPMLLIEDVKIPIVLQFYSKSRDRADLGANVPPNWRKILSNFYPVQLSVGDHRYPTPEHAFHAAKALCSSKPSMALMFTVGGAVGPLASDAKRAGGKGTYRQHGAVLDQRLWSERRDEAQDRIITARLQGDPIFQSILVAIGTRKIRLVHFDRAGTKSYWGASINAQTGYVNGTNRLGRLLTTTASNLVST
jgi:predicted NAD-dependent protein-ADP-ribosyltransferase YbiA (DUF1768 family)